jgi:hypothetical protein
LLRPGRALSGGSPAEFAAVTPEFAGFEDASGSDDTGDELGRRDIKAGIEGAAGGIGDTDVFERGVRSAECGVFGLRISDDAPGAKDFAFVAFFNGDIETGLKLPVDRRERDSDVERDAVAMGKDRLGVSADLVGDFAGAAKGTVTADDNQVDLPALHEVASRVVGNDLMRDLLLGQFPRGKSRALGTRTGLVAEYMEFFPLGLRSVDWGGGATDIDECQPTGIAMCENAHAVTDKSYAMPAYVQAMANILVGEFLGRGQREGLLFLDGFARLHRGADQVHGIDGIHRSGAGGFQSLIDEIDVPLEFGKIASAKGVDALSQTIGCRRADGTGPADQHIANGIGGSTVVGRRNDPKIMRQQPLFNQQDAVRDRVKGDGPVMGGVIANGDKHDQRLKGLGDLDLHLADLILNRAEERMLAQAAQVRVARQPFEIAIAEGKGFI